MNKIDYEFVIAFNHSGIKMMVSGEEVEFTRLHENAPIRPRHLRIAMILVDVMKDAMRQESDKPE